MIWSRRARPRLRLAIEPDSAASPPPPPPLPLPHPSPSSDNPHLVRGGARGVGASTRRSAPAPPSPPQSPRAGAAGAVADAAVAPRLARTLHLPVFNSFGSRNPSVGKFVSDKPGRFPGWDAPAVRKSCLFIHWEISKDLGSGWLAFLLLPPLV